MRNTNRPDAIAIRQFQPDPAVLNQIRASL